MALPVKPFLLLLAVFAQRIGVNPPNPPPSKDDKVTKSGFYLERKPRLFAFINQFSVISFFVTECVVLLLIYFKSAQSQFAGAPEQLLLALCPGSSSTPLPDLSTLSSSFLLGTGMMLAGAALRVWCYKTLGTLFTYEITIRREHKLITGGPYSYVRHPSYTASILLILGAAVVGCSAHGYIRECRIMETPGVRWAIGAWIPFEVYVAIALAGRGKIEDQNLKREFGKGWDEYSQNVPYKFIPGLV